MATLETKLLGETFMPLNPDYDIPPRRNPLFYDTFPHRTVC